MGLFSWLTGTAGIKGRAVAISVHEAFERSEAGSLIIIDVREPSEWNETGRPKGSRGASLRRRDFEEEVLTQVVGDRKRPLALTCRSGARAAQATKRLHLVGFSELLVIEGGFIAWQKASLPIDHGPF